MMSNITTDQAATIGDIAFESKVRADAISESGLRVYGVDRADGLTPDAKYTSKNLDRYKVLRPGMFAYNPMRLNIGSIAYCTDKHTVGLVSPDYVVFGCKPGALDPDFFSYAIKGPEWRQWTAAAGVGSVRVRIYFRELAKMPITVPPLAEQKAIANILGMLDDKIELNQRMNATLEAVARALFQSWFVDFDPVRAKLDGRKPAGLDAATAALFPTHFQDSTLGHIPQGWKATTLGTCIGFQSGFSFKSQDWQESGVPVVKIGSVKPGIIDLTQVSYVSEDIAQQASRYRLSTGDMLIGMTGYVGEVGLVPPSDNPPLLNQRVGKFVLPKQGTESLAFWYCTTRQPEFRAFVEARSHGTAQANVSGEAIMEFPLVSSPAGILDAFNRVCRPLLDRILTNHAESRTLATLRDALLPKLLSGELTIPEMLSKA